MKAEWPEFYEDFKNKCRFQPNYRKERLMPSNRRLSIIAISLTSLLFIYALYSASNSREKIKSISKQIEDKTDSLKIIQGRYDSLHKVYQFTEAKLAHTKNQLQHFQHHIDSLIGLNISLADKINRSLKQIMGQQKQMNFLRSDSTKFRF